MSRIAKVAAVALGADVIGRAGQFETEGPCHTAIIVCLFASSKT